jgi:hypothetical protein
LFTGAPPEHKLFIFKGRLLNGGGGGGVWTQGGGVGTQPEGGGGGVGEGLRLCDISGLVDGAILHLVLCFFLFIFYFLFLF